MSGSSIFDMNQYQSKKSPADRLKKMSATLRLPEMERILRTSKYIVPDIVISGMTTLLFSHPNGGKTLMAMKFMIDAIAEGRVQGEDVFYINADDNYSGLYYKGRIAEKHKFHMISPAQNNVRPDEIIATMLDMAARGEAEGKVFVLDTLKKFADMMNKSSQSRLYQALRELNAKNATVLLLGHANKHLSDEGELVYEGTSDTLNDVDVAYAMYPHGGKCNERQIIEFRNKKDRGNVVPKASFTYRKSKGQSYDQMIASVQRLDENSAREASCARRLNSIREKHASVIHFVRAVLADGPCNESQIIKAYTSGKFETAGEFTRNMLRRGLADLSGHEWYMKRYPAQRNAKVYSLIEASLTEQDQEAENS